MKVLIFPNDPLVAYFKKGELKDRYFNPNNIFQEVHFVTFFDDECAINEIQKTIGNARPAMRLVPVWAPSILNPVRFVLSLLSEVILGVRDEKGTLTIVKNVLCNILIKTNTIK